MEVVRLSEKRPYLQSRSELWEHTNNYFFEIRTNITEVRFPHCHDFIELSLLAQGSLTYLLGDEHLEIESGTLLFTRPKDIHTKISSVPVKLLNISFPESILKSLCNYLGDGFDSSLLIDPKLSPNAKLSPLRVKEVEECFEQLLMMEDKKTQELQVKTLLFTLLTKYFSGYLESAPPPEDWLRRGMRKMEEKENFVEGLPAFLRLTQRTHEHLCREMKRRFQMSPSKFINDLRLSYAKNLLIHTDMDILSIAIESGFNNLGYFYTLFQRRFGVAPLQYKRQFASQSPYHYQPPKI